MVRFSDGVLSHPALTRGQEAGVLERLTILPITVAKTITSPRSNHSAAYVLIQNTVETCHDFRREP